MTLAAVSDQSRALEALRAALKSDSVHHAYLFTGPEGVGKELTAVGFAQALQCTERPGEGCGTCSTCTRIEHHSHPDVTWLMPEDELISRGLAGRSDFTHTPSRDIRVEQVRKLQERLCLRALEAPRKVAIVASAQALNPQAQNAFLKTLEEPAKDTVLVLLTSTPDKLLPTIRSRCSKVHFGPLSIGLIASQLKVLRKLDEPTARLAAVMAGGSLARALSLDVASLSQRKELIEHFEALEPGDARGWLHFAEAFGSSREDAEDSLRLLTVWNRDVAVLQAGAGEVANADLVPLAESAGRKWSAPALHRRAQLLAEAQNAISARNGAARLQLERMLIEIFAPA